MIGNDGLGRGGGDNVDLSDRSAMSCKVTPYCSACAYATITTTRQSQWDTAD